MHPLKIIKSNKGIESFQKNKLTILYSGNKNLPKSKLLTDILEYLKLKNSKVIKINKIRDIKSSKLKVIYTFNTFDEIKTILDLQI